MSETVLESVLSVLYSSKAGSRFNTNLCPRALKHAPRGQETQRSHQDAVSGSRSTKSMSRSPSRSQTYDKLGSERISSTDHRERTASRSRDSERSRSQRSASMLKSEYRSEGSRSTRSSSLSRIKDRGWIDPETQTILDTLPLPQKYLQQSRLPTDQQYDVSSTQHGDVSTAQHGDVSTAQHGDVSTSQYRDVSSSQHGDVSSSQYSDLSSTQHGDVSSSQHGDLSSTQHGDVSSSQHGDMSSSQHGDMSITQHGDVSSSQHGDMSITQHGDVSSSQHGDMSSGQHGDMSSSQHGDVSTQVVHGEEDGGTDSGFSSVVIADGSSSHYRDGSNTDELFKGGRSSRGDPIPTAHVTPHQTLHTSFYRHHQPLGCHHPTASSSAALRRTVSTNDFTDLYFRSASPPPNDGYLLHTAAYGDTGGTVGGRRWNSYQSLQEKNHGEFSALLQDVSRLPAEARIVKQGVTGCDSSRSCSQSHLSLTGCEGSQGTGGALRTASSMLQPHVGYAPAAGNDLYMPHVGTGGSTQDLKACMSAPLSPYSSDHTAHSNYTKADNSNLGSQYGGGFMSPVHPPAAGTPGGVGYDPQVDTSRGHCRHEAWTHANSSDITTWQQHHEEQLRRQHLEATKGLTHGTTSLASLTSLLDPHKLDAVKRAADSIIREKDNIIDKQKMKICDLEKRHQEGISDKHKAMIHQAREENDALHFKLQEVEYECGSLKAKLTEVTGSSGVANVERSLRKSEHQLKELRVSSNNDRQSRLIEQRSIQDMLAAKDAVVSEWQEKYAALQHRAGGSTDLSLTHLSTADSKRSSEMRQLREDKTRYKARSLELERRLEAAKKGYRQRQEQVQHLEQSNSLLQQQVKQLETDTAEMRTDLGLGEDGEHALFVLREEVEDLRHDNHRLHADLDKARKLLDAKHKKQQAVEAQHQGDAKTMEDRLTQEEATVTQLRKDLSNKEQHLKELSASVKELSSQNQDLSEKNSFLQEVQKDLEKQLTGEAHKLEQRLLREMAVCFAELQSLVLICVQRAEGKEPNISVLLGVKGIMNLDPDDMQPVGDNVQSLKYKVTKINELRQDIDNLRELFCNKYAEDMGENLECTTH